MPAWIRYLPHMIALTAILGFGSWVYHIQRDRAALRAENASLRRQVAIMQEQAEQARLAASVARAEAERQAARAAEYDRLREALIGGQDDVDLPDWFRDYLDRLLGGVQPDD